MSPPPQRALILRHGYFPDDPRVRREAAALTAAGLDVTVVCLRRSGEFTHERLDGVSVWRLPWRHRRGSLFRYALEYGASLAAMTTAVAWFVLNRSVALVQVNTLPDWLVFATWPAKLARIPVLLDLHEVSPELAQSRFGWAEDHPAVRILGWLEQQAIGWADACLAVSGPCLERYVERGADRLRFTVVMNSPDPALFAGPNATSVSLSGPLGSGGGSVHGDPARVEDKPRTGKGIEDLPLVVSHGTLAARYGVDLLIEAAALVTEARFVLYGEGEFRAEAERLVDALGLGDRVRLAGSVPHGAIAARIARADVGVVANRSDVFTNLVVPTKLLEYAALGVPVVAAATPAVCATFADDEVQFFPPDDASALAQAIRGVLADPQRARERAERARMRLARDYAWPVQAGRYVELVHRLSAGRSESPVPGPN